MSVTTAGKPSSRFEAKTERESHATLLSRRTLRTLWRALTVRDDDDLTAQEASSTLFRFFRSKHVVDLKLILTLALALLSLHFVFATIFSVSGPAIRLFAAAPNPQRDVIGHTLDVLATGVLPLLIKYFSPAIPIYGGVVAWAYLSAGTRLGVVDLFACEISTLCRVGTIFDIGKRYVTTYESEGTIAEKHAAAKHIAVEHVKDDQSSRSFVSQENYFPIFDSNSKDLQSLEAVVVAHITEYYTYMKAARDLQRKLVSLDVSQIARSGRKAVDGRAGEDPWHETMADTIYVLFLGYESARKSINELIEFQPACAENIIVILLTELVCFTFLCEYLRTDDLRFRRLQLREDDYNDIVPTLAKKVNALHKEDNEKYWTPAKRLIWELEARYKVALETVQRCAKQ